MPAQDDTITADPDGKFRAGIGADVTASLFSVVQGSSVSVASPPANKFDLVAEITFTGRTSGTVRRAQLYWTGTGNNYAWRFFAEREEIWDWEIVADGATGNIETTTSAPELDGLTGSIEVTADATAYGRVTNQGNRWARQFGGPNTFREFSPQFVQAAPESFGSNTTASIAADVSRAVDTEKFNGVFHFLSANMCDANIGAVDWANAGNLDPDPASFDLIDAMLDEAKSRDAVVHFWMYGDTGRGQSPEAGWGTGGATDVVEQRLLRYLCARAGAYPNLVIGYGYDVDEYSDATELDSWAAFVRSRCLAQTMLTARSQTGNTSPYTFWPGADWESRGQGSGWTLISYAGYLDVISDNASKAHSTDDRWESSRLTEAEQRRALWRSTVAGGVSGIYGDPGTAYTNTAYPATWGQFWTPARFDGLVDADSLVVSGGVGALKDSGNTLLVAYAEGSASIDLDLSAFSGTLSVKAVDATVAYSEQTLSTVEGGATRTITLPSPSDWGIVIGE